MLMKFTFLHSGTIYSPGQPLAKTLDKTIKTGTVPAKSGRLVTLTVGNKVPEIEILFYNFKKVYIYIILEWEGKRAFNFAVSLSNWRLYYVKKLLYDSSFVGDNSPESK